MLPTDRIPRVGAGIVRLTADAPGLPLAMHSLFDRDTLVPIMAMMGVGIALAAILTEAVYGMTADLGTASEGGDTLRGLLCVGLIVLAGAWGVQGT